MEVTYIIGHKNPDTDSIASALAYAELKTMQNERVIAGRLGTLNEETKYATRVFDIEAPLLLNDARSKLRDIDFDEPTFIRQDESCNAAYDKIMATNNRTLMVVSDLDDRKLLGLLSIGDLAKIRMSDKSFLNLTDLDTLSKDLKATFQKRLFEPKFDGEVVFFDEKIDLNDLEDKIVVVDHLLGLDKLKGKKMACVILTRNIQEDVDLDTNILSSSLDVISISRLIYEAFPIKGIMSKDPICFNENDFVEDVALKIANTRFRSYPVLNQKGDVLGSISRFHLFKFQPKRFILVDHSMRSQSINYLDKAEVVEIIDHHHIGDVETTKPILYRNEKLGSTCSIIYRMYKENGLLPSKAIAGMMLSAIISDTLYFKSHTTTPIDRKIAQELAGLAGVDLDKYAHDLLDASVSLKDADVETLINQDLKRYHFDKYEIAVSQTNYSNLEDIQARLEEFSKALALKQSNERIDLLIMMFTHVLGEGTMFIYYGPLSSLMPGIIQREFNDHSGFDQKIMSRKQQLIPLLSDAIKTQF